MRKALAVVMGLVVVAGLIMALFFEPVYGNCKDNLDGRTCELIGYQRS